MGKISQYLTGIIVLVVLAVQCNQKQADQKHAPLGIVTKSILATNELFKQEVEAMLLMVQAHKEPLLIRSRFDSARKVYKQMEWAIAYFTPETARFTNGPALDEIEMEEHIVLDAEGLQVVEEFFYPEINLEDSTAIQRHLKKLLSHVNAIDAYFNANAMSDAQLFDALRLQSFRIITLGITGFDTPLSGNGLKEAVYSLQSMVDVLELVKPQYKAQGKLDQIVVEIEAAMRHLQTNNLDKEKFDYLSFISQYLNKISDALYQFRVAEQISAVAVTKAISDSASNLFVHNAFNPDAFIPGEEYRLTAEKVALGKSLFNNNMLSGNGSRSCASCHHPDAAFTDGLAKSVSLTGVPLLRNTPSLNYANYQHGQFWDMRNDDLEGQSGEVMTNKDEMHASFEEILIKINQEDHYKQAFQTIYQEDSAIKVWHLKNVLASYIRSLASFDSKFDLYMQGDSMAMNAQEKEGFNLFVGKGKCATCHFIPLFNGTVPPDFSKTEGEVLGIAQDFRNKQLDADKGRGLYHPTVAQLQGAFKTPTVRNVGKTAPYMHNGGYNTLEQVMTFYNEGGGVGLGFKVDNQTLPTDKLNLTETEMARIIDFMRALNDK